MIPFAAAAAADVMVVVVVVHQSRRLLIFAQNAVKSQHTPIVISLLQSPKSVQTPPALLCLTPFPECAIQGIRLVKMGTLL